MFGLFEKKEKIFSVATGKFVRMIEVPDEVFAKKMLGDGYAIKPSSGDFHAPCDGKIINVFLTKHAITMKSRHGLEILIHVGIDTVGLNGEGFEVFVKDGQEVKAGDKLLWADLHFIESKGLETISPVVITNLELVKSMSLSGDIVPAGEFLGEIKI